MTPQQTATPAATDTLPEYTALRALEKTAIYSRSTPNHDWALLLTEKGEALNVLTALGTTGARIKVINNGIHLLPEGEFPNTVNSFFAPTAINVLRAKAAILRKAAEASRFDAGMSGEWGDRGASQKEAVAAAYEDAIAIIEEHGTGISEAPTDFATT